MRSCLRSAIALRATGSGLPSSSSSGLARQTSSTAERRWPAAAAPAPRSARARRAASRHGLRRAGRPSGTGRSSALEPGRHIGGRAHDENACDAHDDLRQERLLEVADDDLGGQRKKVPMQNISNDCSPHLRSGWKTGHRRKAASAGTSHPDQPGDGQEMHEPQDVEVGLVDRVDLPGEPGRRHSCSGL